MGLHQTKKLLHSEGNYQQKKKPPMEWEKLFANTVSDKGLISKYAKNSYSSTSKKKKKNPTHLKWAEDENRHFPKIHPFRMYSPMIFETYVVMYLYKCIE